MSLGRDEGSGRRGADADRDSRAYAEAHRMLDQYGIAYICWHPEVLLGIAPGSSLADSLWRRYRQRHDELAGTYGAAGVGDESGAAEARLDEILMAHSETERVFSHSRGNHGPGPVEQTERCDPYWQRRGGHRYGHPSYL